MRDPVRIERIMMLLKIHWLKHPDQRFGQMVFNIFHNHSVPEMFYLEDDELLKKLEELNGNS